MEDFQVWIARNKDGSLNFWGGEKPHVPESFKGDFANSNYMSTYRKVGITQVSLPRKMYPEVTYENSPIEYTIIKKGKS